MTEIIEISRSRSGRPVLCEHGGGSDNIGNAQVIADICGGKPAPLHMPCYDYSNGTHAVIVITPGMHIARAHFRRGYARAPQYEYVSIYKIVSISDSDCKAEIELIGELRNGDGNVPAYLYAACQAALEKAHCYHCREAHYVRSPA